ncbi:Fc.00g108340.m01.CDS01 [Cosmosporella sp. VM-42]
MAPGAETVPLVKLPSWEPEKVYKYPMMWLNPVLYMKPAPDADEKVVDKCDDVHSWLNNILDRICDPEYMAVLPYEEGDIVLWNNWGVLHSAIGYPNSYGLRTMHQCHIASSTAPVGPVPSARWIPILSRYGN